MTLTNAEIGFILVCAAGLATALGASLVYFPCFAQLANKAFLAGCLGVAAGVMIFVSFVEIFFKSSDAFVEEGYKENVAFALATALFFAGILLIQLLDAFVHWISDYEHDFEEVCRVVLEENERKTQKKNQLANNMDQSSTVDQNEVKGAPRASSVDGFGMRPTIDNNGPVPDNNDVEMSSPGSNNTKRDPHQSRLSKMGIMTALAIGIHNFPEGLATFLATLDDPKVGAALAVAIGIHNIPEGLCVAIPIYYSTGSRHKAFGWALLSGISEPIGAAIGWAVVVASGGEISQFAYGVLFGIVAGMMVSICIKELLPTAFRYDPRDKVVTYAAIAGMAIMALSLILFQLSSDPEEDD